MQGFDIYAEKAKSEGMSKAKTIDTSNVVVRNWVRIKCQYGCEYYARCLSCPPFSPTPDFTKDMIGEYSKGLLMQIEHISIADRPRMRNNFKKPMVSLERRIFLDGYYKAFGMASGPCRLCKACDTTADCKHPYQARPSMEACGIDVYQTARNCGFRLDVVRAEDCLFSYVGLILVE